MRGIAPYDYFSYHRDPGSPRRFLTVGQPSGVLEAFCPFRTPTEGCVLTILQRNGHAPFPNCGRLLDTFRFSCGDLDMFRVVIVSDPWRYPCDQDRDRHMRRSDDPEHYRLSVVQSSVIDGPIGEFLWWIYSRHRREFSGNLIAPRELVTVHEA